MVKIEELQNQNKKNYLFWMLNGEYPVPIYPPKAKKLHDDK